MLADAGRLAEIRSEPPRQARATPVAVRAVQERRGWRGLRHGHPQFDEPVLSPGSAGRHGVHRLARRVDRRLQRLCSRRERCVGRRRGGEIRPAISTAPGDQGDGTRLPRALQRARFVAGVDAPDAQGRRPRRVHPPGLRSGGARTGGDSRSGDALARGVPGGDRQARPLRPGRRLHHGRSRWRIHARRRVRKLVEEIWNRRGEHARGGSGHRRRQGAGRKRLPEPGSLLGSARRGRRYVWSRHAGDAANASAPGLLRRNRRQHRREDRCRLQGSARALSPLLPRGIEQRALGRAGEGPAEQLARSLARVRGHEREASGRGVAPVSRMGRGESRHPDDEGRARRDAGQSDVGRRISQEHSGRHRDGSSARSTS